MEHNTLHRSRDSDPEPIRLTSDFFFKYVFGSEHFTTGRRRSPHISPTLQRWSYYMHERGEVNAVEDPILLQILKEDPDIEDADGLYRQFVANDELRGKYQDRIKAERDRRSETCGWSWAEHREKVQHLCCSPSRADSSGKIVNSNPETREPVL